MKIKILGCLAALPIAGCNEAVDRCEDLILGTLHSPSTYQRVEVIGGSPAQGDREANIIVRYDAENAFGAPVRSISQCTARVSNDGEILVESLAIGHRPRGTPEEELEKSRLELEESQRLLRKAQRFSN